ncbi:MAG: hypothetical protein HYY06_20805 [Deltaproteobacteria bacterium]|nr:hypothetical protein [Deltaproteobacteria bacterium]
MRLAPTSKQLVFHLGAHRAGSSTIQGTLERRRDELDARGVGVFVRRDLAADALMRPLLAIHRGSLRALPSVWPLVRAPGSTVVISEESLLGLMPGRRGASFYPGHVRAIRGLRWLARFFDVRLRWIVRRQDRLLESIFSFRVSRGETDDFATFAARCGHLAWLPIARALEASGIADVRVALFEDLFDAGTEARLGAFLDLPGSDSWREPMRRGNVGLRGPALQILRYLNRAASLDPEQRRAAHATLQPYCAEPPPEEDLAQAFERGSLGRLARLSASALSFAAAAPPTGFDDAARRDFLRRHEADNRQLLRMRIVVGDAARWEL